MIRRDLRSITTYHVLKRLSHRYAAADRELHAGMMVLKVEALGVWTTIPQRLGGEEWLLWPKGFRNARSHQSLRSGRQTLGRPGHSRVMIDQKRLLTREVGSD